MPMTEAQRKAANERIKAMHAKKKAEQEPVERPDMPEEQPPQPESQPEIVTPSANNDDIAELLRRIKELEARQIVNQAPQQPTIGSHGLVGTYVKFQTDPSLYPDETKRLSEEPKLQRFAFPLNYELEYSVGISSYTTIDNVRMREPKFTLKLIRKIMDEETGELTNKRFINATMVFHEDPETALVIAHEAGIQVDELNEALFLNEMRYLRMRDWLLECFYPPIPSLMDNKKTVVIGNRQVDMYEVNGEQTQSIPFNQLAKKF